MGGVVTTNFDMDKVYQKLSLTQDSFMDICKTGNRNIWAELETGLIETNTFWKLFNEGSAKLGVPEVKNDLFRLYFHPKLNPGTVEVINALKKNNRVICGTNTIQSHWENHLERGDYALFDQTYASNKIGVAKPNQEYFKVILEAENCNPENAFFVDDKIANVMAAKNVGINAVQFTDAQSLYQQWSQYF